MQKFIIMLVLFLFGFTPLVANTNNLTMAANQTETSEIEEEQIYELSKMKFNTNIQYLNVGEISVFEIFQNKLFYANETGTLFCYNLITEQLQNNVLSLTNITKIQSTTNYLFILADNELTVINKENNIVNKETIVANTFSVFEKNDVIYFTGVNNNQLLNYKYNALNFNLIEMRAPYSLLGITEIISIANDDVNAYLIHKINNTDKFTVINHNLLTQTDLAYGFKNTSNLILLHHENKTVFANICLTNQNLCMFIINEENKIEEFINKVVDNGLNPTFQDGECATFTDIKFLKDKFYIADKENKTVQSFSYLTTENNAHTNLVFDKVIVASSGYAPARFNEVNNILTTSDDEFYISDTNNNRIQIFKNNNITTIDSYLYNGMHKNFNNPSEVVVDSLKNIYINNKIELIKLNRKHDFQNKASEINMINGTNETIKNLSSICMDINGNIYAIDSTLQSLLKMDYDKNYFNEIKFDVTYSQKSIIKYDIKNDCLILFTPNLLTYLNFEGTIINSIEITNGKSLDIDFNGYTFVLNDNSIDKYYLENGDITKLSSFKLDFSKYSNLSLSKELGTIYLFENVNSYIAKLTVTSFSNGLNNFVHPINIYENNLNEKIISTGIIKNNCFIYSFPYNVGSNFEMAENDNVIVLDSTTYTSYVFVLYNENNSLSQGYIAKSNLTIVENTAQSNLQKLIVINKKIKIYKYPTLLKDKNNKNIVIQECLLDDVLINICELNERIDNSNFFAVQLNNNVVGYVNSADVTYSNNSNIKPLIKTNAKIIAPNNYEVVVYANANSDSINLGVLLDDTDIKVESYNEKATYTKITFINDNLEEITGYILTKYIKMDHISNYTTTIILIVASVVLLIAITITFVVIKKKNKE